MIDNGQIQALKEDVSELKSDVKEIMTNDLPHIRTDIGKLEVRMTIFGGIILTALAALIAKAFAILA